MWESKRKLLKTCLFSVLRRKTLKLIQTNQYQQAEKTLPKMYILSVFELVTYKKNAKMDTKHSILGNKGTMREKCIMNVL